MNADQSDERGWDWLLWAVIWIAFLVVVGAVYAKRNELRRRAAIVQIDSSGTARVGGVLPLSRLSLGIAKHANGGGLAVVADKGTSITNVVRVLDALSKATTNSGHQSSPIPR